MRCGGRGNVGLGHPEIALCSLLPATFSNLDTLLLLTHYSSSTLHSRLISTTEKRLTVKTLGRCLSMRI